MRHNKIIYFLSTQVVEDDIGNRIETPIERKVFANELSVSSNEFYNAAATGLKPSKRFEVYSFEYQGEAKIKHDNIVYKIIRTESKGEKMRITCERALSDV